MIEFICDNLTEFALIFVLLMNFLNWLNIQKLKNQVQFLQFTQLRGESDESKNRDKEGT